MKEITRLDLSFNVDLNKPEEKRKVTIDALGYSYKNHHIHIRSNNSEEIGEYYSISIKDFFLKIISQFGMQEELQYIINHINNCIDNGTLTTFEIIRDIN